MRKKRRSRIVDAAAWAGVIVLLIWAFVPKIGLDLLSIGDHLDQIFVNYSGEDSASGATKDNEAVRVLHTLPVRDADPKQEYNRDAFGPAWADVDHNGCDTRNDILKRDLARPQFKDGTHDCIVLSGTLAEPYTGTVVDFLRGQDTSSLVQIDHVVALANAWKSGAWAWTGDQRQLFANDPLNLLAVDGPANRDKQAGSADQWLPPNKDFRCDYVSRQIAVKAKWNLTVTQLERDAMTDVLEDCPAQPLPVSTTVLSP